MSPILLKFLFSKYCHIYLHCFHFSSQEERKKMIECIQKLSQSRIDLMKVRSECVDTVHNLVKARGICVNERHLRGINGIGSYGIVT